MTRKADDILRYDGPNPFGDSQPRNYADTKILNEFYPTSCFWSLFNDQHEVLLGTRGSGKTYLLKAMSRYTANIDTFDEKTLSEIARITGGQFYRASSGARLQKAFNNIDKLEKTEAKRRTLISYEELFPWALGAAAIFLLLGLLLNFARPRPAP